MKGVVLGFAIVVLVLSCATNDRARTTFDAEMQHRIDKMNEITELWGHIRLWRAELKMDLDASASSMFEVRGKTVKDAQKVCPENRKIPGACEDTCQLSRLICENAELICKIADELPKHDRAQQKCTSAKASCRDAKKLCCGCKPKPAVEPASEPKP